MSRTFATRATTPSKPCVAVGRAGLLRRRAQRLCLARATAQPRALTDRSLVRLSTRRTRCSSLVTRPLSTSARTALFGCSIWRLGPCAPSPARLIWGLQTGSARRLGSPLSRG
eukprot:Amastigsp_a4917_8.p3 type:complete len:113 gc:universal Amastigsp_a4917_8:468-806(+)